MRPGHATARDLLIFFGLLALICGFIYWNGTAH